MVKFYTSDCRKAGDLFCVEGCELFFEQNNLNFKDFVKNGIDVEILKSLNNDLVNQIIKAAGKFQ